MNLLNTPRHVNPNLANLLADVGEPNWDGDVNIFKEIFIQSSPEELLLIRRCYKKKTGNKI